MLSPKIAHNFTLTHVVKQNGSCGLFFSKIRLKSFIKSYNVSEAQYKNDMINLSVPKIPHCEEKKLVLLLSQKKKKGIQQDVLIVSEYKT